MQPPDWREVFLAALRETPNVAAAARAAGHNRQHAYAVRDEDPDFAAAWDDALAEAVDWAEGEAYRRAVRGVEVERGVYYEGKRVAAEKVVTYSDTLLIFLLKAHRPKLYRETLEVVQPRKTAEDLSDEELAAIAAGRQPCGSSAGDFEAPPSA